MRIEESLAALLKTNRRRKVPMKVLEGLGFPRSLTAFVARFGWVGGQGNALKVGPGTPMWSYSTREMFEGAIDEHRSDRSTPGASFGKADDWRLLGSGARTHGGEWMWLWLSHDWAHPDGAAVAPLGASFDEAMLAALLGVHAAVFCHQEIHAKAIAKLCAMDFERAASWNEALTRIEELTEELSNDAWEVERYARFEPERIRARLAIVRARLPTVTYAPRARIAWGAGVTEAPDLRNALKRAVMGLDFGDRSGLEKLEVLLDATPNADVDALLDRLGELTPHPLRASNGPRHPSGMPVGAKGPYLELFRLLIDRGARPKGLAADEILTTVEDNLGEGDVAIAVYSKVWPHAARKGTWEAALASRAAFAGAARVVGALIDRGTDMTAPDASGTTPLVSALLGASARGSGDVHTFTEVISQLVEGGVALNGPEGGSSALALAVQLGVRPLIDHLLSLGANAELPTEGLKLSARGVARMRGGDAAEWLGVEPIEIGKSEPIALVDRASCWWRDAAHLDVAERAFIVIRPIAVEKETGVPSTAHFASVPAEASDAFRTLVHKLASGACYDLVAHGYRFERARIRAAGYSYGVGDVEAVVRLYTEAGYRVLRYEDLWP